MSTITINASNLVAILAAHARSICAACDSHAVGAPMPKAADIQYVLDEMERLNGELRTMQTPAANKSAA